MAVLVWRGKKQKQQTQARYPRAEKDSPFLRIPKVCEALATGLSDMMVDMIVVYKMMIDKRILFWRCKCSGRRNPTSLGSGLSRLAEGTKHGHHHDLESCFFHVCFGHHLHHIHHNHHLLSDLLSPVRMGSRLLHDARTRNAKHMKVVGATQP